MIQNTNIYFQTIYRRLQALIIPNAYMSDSEPNLFLIKLISLPILPLPSLEQIQPIFISLTTDVQENRLDKLL